MTVQIAMDSLGKALKKVMAQKYLWKNQTQLSVNKSLLTLSTKLFSIKYV